VRGRRGQLWSARCGLPPQLPSDEACDDGTQADADGSSHDSKSRETFGNGYFDLHGEQCDDAGESIASCPGDCTNPLSATP
jgi:hypothetical protein